MAITADLEDMNVGPEIPEDAQWKLWSGVHGWTLPDQRLSERLLGASQRAFESI